ncbi:ABC transporter ATP-binding protein [Paenibacillus abyssi]|uniref:Carnitine transport ATP-binding protein OpuCA n=1 Tax=Paenibacillus abyssi TaxID=1340531 RepID=A0A917CV84_9BACL|nr:ABC transporter ATP-binding protein [Paenibacillus abyssi]GGG00815.1 iron ABC transporter ATP-binding protein [Paenibacillus abyssi]
MSYLQMHDITKQFHDGSKPAVMKFELEMNKGEIVSFLGPSGCGKTTTLRMIAGFERPSSGKITIENELICDNHFSLPPEKRGIGMVFQDYALFPHLSVIKNVMFGLHKWGGKEKKMRAEEVLEIVGLLDFADRYPHELSGGQQQRVALARAMAPNPRLILLDEPFSNLDVKLRERMRFELKQILYRAKMTAILVTHDQKDAFAVSDRVVVMNAGEIQQIAEPRSLYRCPKNCFVAEFLGKTNLLTGKLDADLKHVFTGIGKICLPVHTTQQEDQVMLSIRPEGCRIKSDGKFNGSVEGITYCGEYQEVLVRLNTQENNDQLMVIHAQVEENLQVGDTVYFDITPELVALVEAV